jgi:hypothetical protein
VLGDGDSTTEFVIPRVPPRLIVVSVVLIWGAFPLLLSGTVGFAFGSVPRAWGLFALVAGVLSVLAVIALLREFAPAGALAAVALVVGAVADLTSPDPNVMSLGLSVIGLLVLASAWRYLAVVRSDAFQQARRGGASAVAGAATADPQAP